MNISICMHQNVLKLDSSSTVGAAASFMKEHDVGAVLIMDGSVLRGIFTERDLARKVVAVGLSPDKTTLGEVMSRAVVTVNLDWDVDEALKLMEFRRFRHLPVVNDDQKVIGMLSVRDLLYHIAQHLFEENKMLKESLNGASAA